MLDSLAKGGSTPGATCAKVRTLLQSKGAAPAGRRTEDGRAAIPSRRQSTGMCMPNVTPKSPLTSPPPEAWEPLLRFARLAGRPLEQFLRIQAASGILLLVAAAVALACANSPWA